MNVQQLVRNYYGNVLQGTDDLRTNTCCTAEDLPDYIQPLLSDIHPEVQARYYGCGLVVPEDLDGLRVLDLGCGTGRDCYLLSRLVGPEGYVVGVDMTEEQLAVARRHLDYHTQRFGYNSPNVEFHLGQIERLDELPLEPDSFDLIISNCVINLCADKAGVFSQIRTLLKAGGEFYFSDIYADRRVPRSLREDPVLYGECLGGALYWNDFLLLAREAGFADPRLVNDRPVALTELGLAERVGNVRFFSATYRLFRLGELEAACEDYGQAVIYQGTVPYHPHRFVLDKHHVIETGRVLPVCGNTWRMLHETRLAPHFQFVGDGKTHLGIFPGCGTTMPFDIGGRVVEDEGGCC